MVLDVKAEDLPRYSQSLHQQFVFDSAYSDPKVYELLFARSLVKGAKVNEAPKAQTRSNLVAPLVQTWEKVMAILAKKKEEETKRRKPLTSFLPLGFELKLKGFWFGGEFASDLQ